MLSRLVVLFLTVLGGIVFGQTRMTGMFGPVSTRLSAGDRAPDVLFNRVLSAPPGAGSWSASNLSGKTTVLLLFPDTSHNLQSVTEWNKLIEEMAAKPVQFVWITAEADGTLTPFLQQHPIKGWVMLDPTGETGRSYGMETPEMVIVGADRKILGFDMAFVPQKNTVLAALDGRITTTPVKPGKAGFEEFMASRKVLMHAQPQRLPGPEDHRPNFPPSDTLHISPAQSEDGGDFSSDDYKSLHSFDLRMMIGELYQVSPVRIQLPAALDDGKKYDFDLVLPKPESEEEVRERYRRGIQEHFHVNITREERAMDVYVVTAPESKLHPYKPEVADDDNIGFAFGSSVEFQVAHAHGEFAWPPKSVALADIRGVSVEGSAGDFCRRLEDTLDRPVVNETNLTGSFEFHVKLDLNSREKFLDVLRSQLGLAITPATRTVEIVQVTPR